MVKNFKIEEFACKDGTPVPQKYKLNVLKLATELQVLRSFIDRPITILSGYRTELHNQKVGGTSRSQHLTASAGDIRTIGYTAEELAMIIEVLILTNRMNDGGLGVYNTFVHYDIGRPRRWKG